MSLYVKLSFKKCHSRVKNSVSPGILNLPKANLMTGSLKLPPAPACLGAALGEDGWRGFVFSRHRPVQSAVEDARQRNQSRDSDGAVI